MRRLPTAPDSPRAPILSPCRRRSPASLALLLLVPLLLSSGAVPAAAEKLVVLGESAQSGIFDPSIAVDPDSGEAWLAYSAVFGSAVPWGPNVETHLARSQDGGATYTFVTAANASEPAIVVIGGVATAGFFNHEVPSLAYDAGDPGGEWKLLTHRMFRRSTSPFPFDAELNEPAYSWLELWEAPAPTGPWSRVVRLGAGPTPLAPFGVDQGLNPLDPQLASVAVYSEPGLFAESGVLHLSLSGLSGIAPHRSRVVLFRSNDQGATWTFVRSLLEPADAAALGFVDFDGSAIVREQGRSFLLASSGTASVPRDGLALFEFSSLASGTLYGARGGPVLLDHVCVDPAPGGVPFGGQGEFDEGAPAGGILMSQLETAAYPAIFSIEKTGRTPVPEPVVAPGLLLGLLGLPGPLAGVACRGKRRRRCARGGGQGGDGGRAVPRQALLRART